MPFLTTELVTYAIVSGVGLILTVYAMLHGSVRIKVDPTQMTPPPAAFNRPVIGSAIFAFGVVGYVFTRYANGSPTLPFIAACAAAIVAWIGVTTLMAKWAFKGPIVDPHEELEELQGTVAVVTRNIPAGGLGEITYTFREQATHVAARSIDGNAVDAGVEVVIEKIENDVADVELWSVVETRL